MTAAQDETVLLELDERRRVSLGRVGRSEHRRYLATAEADGTIVLVPAVVMTELEARFLANPQLVQRVREAREHPERLVKHHRQTS